MPMDASMLQSVPDLAGENYGSVLDRLHRVLEPASYLEIGTNAGDSLRFARCATIAIDPKFSFVSADPLEGKPLCALYQMTSDAFFANHDPRAVLGRPIDMAFLDGMHLSEFLLRDFMNTEKYCRRNAIIAIHDCVPLDHDMARRDPESAPSEPNDRPGWWTGDIWRFILLLKRRRQDLRITVLDAPPTGLVLVTNLSPDSTLLYDNYARFVEEMHGESLADLTLAGLHAELVVEPTSILQSPGDIAARFWL